MLLQQRADAVDLLHHVVVVFVHQTQDFAARRTLDALGREERG